MRKKNNKILEETHLKKARSTSTKENKIFCKRNVQKLWVERDDKQTYFRKFTYGFPYSKRQIA